VGTVTTDNRPNLGKISRPALLVVTKGGFDAVYAAIQKGIPGARMEQFEDAGHALFVDDAARFNALLDQFVAGLPAAASATH
jgi:pimeloyl-ACP methyl ester carboxylesterase